MTEEKPDNRTHLMAIMACGCCCIIMTKSDPDCNYKADASDIADFYKSVAKAEKKGKSPIEVQEFRGDYKVNGFHGIGKCPNQTKKQEQTSLI